MKPSILFRTADELTERTISTTGDETLDTLLGGGLELGMCHLFYGDRILHDDLLRMAVAAQIPRAKEGLAEEADAERARLVKWIRLRVYFLISISIGALMVIIGIGLNLMPAELSLEAGIRFFVVFVGQMLLQ